MIETVFSLIVVLMLFPLFGIGIYSIHKAFTVEKIEEDEFGYKISYSWGIEFIKKKDIKNKKRIWYARIAFAPFISLRSIYLGFPKPFGQYILLEKNTGYFRYYLMPKTYLKEPSSNQSL